MLLNAERDPPEPWNVATILMVVIGCVVLACDAWHTLQTALFLSHAIHVTGVIIDPASHPTIRFGTPEGAVVEFVQNGFVSLPRGAAVPVAYDPLDPAKTARAATFWASWGESLWALPMGLGFALLPLFGARARFRFGR